MKSTPVYWYSDQKSPAYFLLLPFSWLFCFLVWLRRSLYRLGILRSRRLAVPVIVVGNITAGGSGKTPLVMWLARFLQDQGFHPGIVSRGYGGKARSWPQQVRSDSDYVAVGDEAVMIAARTECPMAVGPDRVSVGQSLLQHHDIDVILSDDGLQHYALKRNIEIAVVDGERRFGNGQCLPAGPLRERPARLSEVDMIVVNGIAQRHEHSMTVSSQFAVNLKTSETLPLSGFSGKVHALAGIGNPERFFSELRNAGLHIEEHEFPDHYPYSESDVEFADELPVLMTEKDAVKCVRFANSRLWCVPAKVELGNAFGQRLLMLLEKQNQK
jgi:tetraacyldisaccharide 4'-kinase